MKLAPLVNAPAPAYPPGPARRVGRSIARWARRIGTAAATAAALGTAGCYGLTPLDEEPDAGEVPEDPAPEPVDPGPGPLPRLPRLDPLPEPEPEPPPEPEPDVCVPEYRLSGMVAPPSYFSCDPDAEPSFTAPLYLGAGERCEEPPSFARFEVPEPSRLRVTILPGAADTLLTVMDPAGEVVAEIGPEASCADLDMQPGIWTLRADAATPDAHPTGWFEFYVDAV